MTSITLFTLETAQDLYNTSEAFPVDFDIAWQVLGYSRKDNAKRKLVEYCIKDVDYRLLTIAESAPNGGLTHREDIFLTVDCFKELGMLAKTEKGKEIRQYFLQCERIAKQKTLEQSQAYQKLLERCELDEKKLEFLKLSEKICRKTNNTSGLLTTRRQITDYLEATRPEMRLKASITQKPTKPVYPVPDAKRVKIFEDLIKACKGQEIKVSVLRNHHLGRRLDVRGLYGVKSEPWLKKVGICSLFTDAAKHGYGSFDPVENVFKPFTKDSSHSISCKAH